MHVNDTTSTERRRFNLKHTTPYEKASHKRNDVGAPSERRDGRPNRCPDRWSRPPPAYSGLSVRN